jgi:murein DD-endopeptidase MepM/ murein hydrolase activator NlpD
MAKTWMLPFPDSHLGTKFGVTDAAHPNGHRGTDWNGLPAGTKLPAVADGTIVLVQWSNALGNVVVLKVTRKVLPPVYFGYCHMAKASPLQVGAKVKMGEPVGLMGNTGTASSGRHLHLTCSYLLMGVFAGKVMDAWAFLKKKIKEEASA